MEEIWKPVVGYDGFYEVSNLGQIRSLDRVDKKKRFWKGRILKQYPRKGYLHVNLSVNGERNSVAVHRVVAEAFLLNPKNKPQVNHIDENKANNVVSNLEFCTACENVNHGTRSKRSADSQRGEKSHSHRITSEQVNEIRENYVRGSKQFGQKAFADKFGISISAVSLIILGKTWIKEVE